MANVRCIRLRFRVTREQFRPLVALILCSGYNYQHGDRAVAIDIQQASQQHFARIHRAALVLCGNPWDADDLAQETFLVLARQGGAFEGRSSIYTWLYGILLNLERRERRRYGMRRRKLQVLWDSQPATSELSPGADARAEVSEWKKSLW